MKPKTRKPKESDKDTVVAYHEFVQGRIQDELNGVDFGPGHIPCTIAKWVFVFGFLNLIVGILVVGLRYRHVYLWDWNDQFLGPFFFIMFLLCSGLATWLILFAKRRANAYRRDLVFRPKGDYGVMVVHKSVMHYDGKYKSDLKSGTNPHNVKHPYRNANNGYQNRAYKNDRNGYASDEKRRPDDRRGPEDDNKRRRPDYDERRPDDDRRKREGERRRPPEDLEERARWEEERRRRHEQRRPPDDPEERARWEEERRRRQDRRRPPDDPEKRALWEEERRRRQQDNRRPPEDPEKRALWEEERRRRQEENRRPPEDPEERAQWEARRRRQEEERRRRKEKMLAEEELARIRGPPPPVVPPVVAPVSTVQITTKIQMQESNESEL
ncbi:hypothetical protein CHS0354_031371 [Potamilus streckersoni]|uniref:Uncharacterized protein n=1 Tax=Potamilus streckersoni TaxID=2493646 RepID=A0AAE0VX33_9BIVA|nr:hypothetical protein CHS0354_031371 [Potamilus streckersoni]